MSSRGQDEKDKSLRDLMGLLALPTLWSGKNAEAVLHLTAQAVGRILPVRLVLARWRRPRAEQHSDFLYVDGHQQPPAVEGSLRRFIDSCVAMDHQSDRQVIPDTLMGPVSVIRLFMGAGRHGGALWFASDQEGFPSTHDVAFLRAAVTLATTGINTACVVEERENANRAKDEFLAMLGHELRNPLAPIVTALHLIKKKNSGTLGREHQIIERQVGHLSRLVDDLLDVTRITRGKVQLNREAVFLDNIINDALESVSPLLEEKRHLVRVALDPKKAVVFGDPGRLRQVVSNLLTNAAKYTAPGGQIEVSTVAGTSDVALVVRDNGVGMDAETLGRVFNIFEQGEVSIARSEGGLGIGLAVVKRLTELHGGSVDARSAGSGQGSEFTLRMPLWKGPVRSINKAEAAPTADEPGSQLRVLLIDDNVDALHMLSAALVHSGYVVANSTDAVQGLELVRKFQPDVAVLDIGLPVVDGYELARWIRASELPRQPRLIALTGYGQPTDRSRAAAAGFDDHLVKPVSLERLTASISLVRRPSAKPRLDG